MQPRVFSVRHVVHAGADARAAGAPTNCECAPTTRGGHICVYGPRLGDECGYPEQSCEPYLSCLVGAPAVLTGAPVNPPVGHCGAPGGAGEACTRRLFVIDCKPGLHCAPNGTCSPRLSEGAPCAAPFACNDGLWCAGLALRLPASIDPPEYISSNDGPITVATLGTCARPLRAGAACTPASDRMSTYAIGGDGCAPFESSCDATQKRCVAYAP